MGSDVAWSFVDCYIMYHLLTHLKLLPSHNKIRVLLYYFLYIKIPHLIKELKGQNSSILGECIGGTPSLRKGRGIRIQNGHGLL